MAKKYFKRLTKYTIEVAHCWVSSLLLAEVSAQLKSQLKTVDPIQPKSVFSLTLARSPMASSSYRRASDFLSYSPGLASYILAENPK